MKMKTMKELLVEQAEINKQITLLETLISFGMSEKSSIHWDVSPINVYSNYSMGELIKFQCNGKTFAEQDKRQFYKGKYQNCENHGLIVFNFTKKALKEYLNLCEKIHRCPKTMQSNFACQREKENAQKAYLNIMQDIRSLINSCIDEKNSKAKNNKISIL